ncbi:TetR/AcrR family transcriptional regulator [Mycobacterium sp. M1]|uniref:TetR/AcrR family transcriptional regulator n=1 Tax=Mycolicibacter acidiphilus TaxID=2835306 RepID=A0ABS5RIW9_9MYCO|nr:TetR/AcrR family transcriptional regulator [Mycolicibacter acidiphilus]
MTGQERDALRRTRLLDTAIEILGTRGAAETTVTAVCAESGVTSRYFYQHFSDRSALLRAVAERLNTTLQATIVAAIPEASSTPETLTPAPLRALVQMIDDDARLGRILFVESGTDPVLRQLRNEVMASFADLVVTQARLHLDISDDAADLTRLSAVMGVGGLFEVFHRWIDGELPYTADQFAEHCAGLLGSLAGYVLFHDVVHRGDGADAG